MKILEFESIGGASGDMILAALLDLGVDRAALMAHLRTMPLEAFDIEAQAGVFNGLRGLQVRVKTPTTSAVDAPEKHKHHHGHAHPHHGSAGSARGHALPRRGLEEIRAVVAAGNLPVAVKEMSLRVFERLAEAEALVHGVTPDKIHFHEIGAVDSIVDIVGCCLARNMLGVDAVWVGALPLGCGNIQTAHGVLPSPAPATVELLKNWPTVPTGEPFELVTPTGAALLTTWHALSCPPAGRILRAGYGFGHARLQGRPNLLRAVLREASENSSALETCLVLECNLDDMSPALVGALTDRLLQAGALDVFVAPVQMKKQRPGVLLTALCRHAQREKLMEVLLAESTTFGVREYAVARTVLDRRHEEVQTPYGSVRVKIGSRHGRDLKFMPEYADCLALAEKHNMPLLAVFQAAVAAAESLRQKH